VHSTVCAVVVMAAVSAASATAHSDCRAHSPDRSTALIELYTSEGCDSCPPADRWLSSLSTQGLGDRAVALAFHVDYWDRLGWTDRFGNAAFSQRQRDQSSRTGGAFVYTPQVLLQGRDFSQWNGAGELKRAIVAINGRPARAVLDLTVHPHDSTVDVDLTAHGVPLPAHELLFSESHGRAVVTCAPERAAALTALAGELGVKTARVGRVGPLGGAVRVRLRDAAIDAAVGRLREVYFSAIPRRMGD